MTTLEAGSGALSDYYEWFRTAPHGALLVYHQGDLQFDRDQDLAVNEGRLRAKALSALADRVRKDCESGFLVLTQRRLGPSHFAYRATRIRKGSEPAYEAPLRHGEYQPA